MNKENIRSYAISKYGQKPLSSQSPNISKLFNLTCISSSNINVVVAKRTPNRIMTDNVTNNLHHNRPWSNTTKIMEKRGSNPSCTPQPGARAVRNTSG